MTATGNNGRALPDATGRLDDVLAVRKQIEAALAYAHGSFTFDDVVFAVLAGRMQFWRKDESVVITQVTDYPRYRECFVFLAGGDLKTIEQMHPAIEAWAVAQNCTAATMAARKGWTRTFLNRAGWQEVPEIILRKPLGGA